MSDEKELATGPGTFGWNELMTSDVDAAKAFYKKVFAWEAETETMSPGFEYTLFKKEGKMLAGMLGISKAMGPVQPHWMSYVGSKDIAADVEKARQAGATVLKDVMEIPGVGSLAVIKDPQGAVFSMWQASADCSEK